MSYLTLTFTLACTLFCLTNAAHAMKIHVDMKPPLLGKEFAFEMNSKENGKVAFIIKRDPSKASEPADAKLRLVRGACLSVIGRDGFVAGCPIAPETEQNGILVYRFELNDQYARSSRFVLSEIEDYREGTGYIGGGTVYTFRLIDFIDPTHGINELRKSVTYSSDAKGAFVGGQGILPAAPYDSNPKCAEFVKMIHRDFEDCLMPSAFSNSILYAHEEFLFSGDAKHLTAFLMQVSRLPNIFTVNVYLSGPARPGVDPLDSAIAQTAVEYDWKVQIIHNTKVSIFVPIASRIPFAQIGIPKSLKVEASPEVQGLARNFLRLRDAESSAELIK